jgi:hypothetical protein
MWGLHFRRSVLLFVFGGPCGTEAGDEDVMGDLSSGVRLICSDGNGWTGYTPWCIVARIWVATREECLELGDGKLISLMCYLYSGVNVSVYFVASMLYIRHVYDP